MAFSAHRKQRQLTVFLAFLAVGALLFVAGYGLRYAHHRHMLGRLFTHMDVERKKAIAGVDSVTLDNDRISLSGWAPADADVALSDHDKALDHVMASASGKWTTSVPLPKRNGPYQVLGLSYQEKNKDNALFARIAIYMPDKSPDDATVWVRTDNTVQLMQTPDPSGDDDMYLAFVSLRDKIPVQFSGHAAPGNLVQAYADNLLIGTAPAGDDGYWTMTTVLDVTHKTANLRFDEIGNTGVAERRLYHPDWLDMKTGDAGAVQATKDGSALTETTDDGGKALSIIYKPDAGSSESADEELPGQIIPAKLPVVNGK